MTDYLHALPSGYRIEEYELVRVLGRGGFGITYLGYGHHLDKADYEWGLERFLSEARCSWATFHTVCSDFDRDS